MALDRILLTSKQLSLPPAGVRAVVALLEGGATVPFIARYRKEATGELDEVQIRAIEEKHRYLGELEDRRAAILAEIEKQGKLSPELRAQIETCDSKTALEDLYLPYKPKRRTRAQIARERGLEPLADRILEQPMAGSPAVDAASFIDAQKGVVTVDDALAGARDIVAEVIAERASVRAYARELFAKEGVLRVAKSPDVNGPTKFEAYYQFAEPLRSIPSHRFLAVRRGENEGVLASAVEVDGERAKARIASTVGLRGASPFAGELGTALGDTWKRLLAPSIETEVRAETKLRADAEAVKVFAQNLRALLLAAPLGARPVIGIDPGQRTGCKVAVVDATGKLLEHTVLYLVQGEAALVRSQATLAALVIRHKPAAIAIGNGTHGRETEAFAQETLESMVVHAEREGATAAERETAGALPLVVAVNESGASIYSASDAAREELPDLDLTVRGAVSIGRRLQDPLAELVKIDPQSIGVGQYQHDVHPPFLAEQLSSVVESCVNEVGVEVNTASPHLLAYVSGIGVKLAKKVVAHRDEKGPFKSRKALLKVAGLGQKTFEQAAGFLRVSGAADPLDASAVHPERYGVVEAMAKDLGAKPAALVGNDALVARIEWQRYVAEGLGEPTLKDILAELKRPGRDPRATFEPPKFRDDVRTLADLRPGMSLEGVVTNVTAFGAFVDVGVHQDGLVHVSQLANRFVRDPAEVVKPGDKLTVRVVEVDLVRKRIALSARTDGGAVGAPRAQAPSAGGDPRPRAPQETRTAPSAPPPGTGVGAFRNNPFEKLKR